MRIVRAMALLVLLGAALAAPLPYQVSGKVVYQARGPMGAFKGTNTAVSGEVRWDSQAGTLTGKVCVDLSKWDSGEPLRDKHTRGMFEVTKYPEACLKVTGLEGDPKSGEVKLLGNLTIHGVTRPVVIPGKVRFKGDSILFEGYFETKITDWKMRRPSLLGFKVRDLVKVWVYGEARPR